MSALFVALGASQTNADDLPTSTDDAATGVDDYLEFGDMPGTDEEECEALTLGEQDTDSNEEEPEEPAPAAGEEDTDSDEEDLEEPGCKPFEPTSPEARTDGKHLPASPEGACDFYLEVPSHFPSGQGGIGPCSDHMELITGYHQTCANVSAGFEGVGVRVKGCNNGTSQPAFRTYVDELRICLQEEVTDLSTTDGCLTPGTSCGEVVDNIRDAHSGCNEKANFCSTMEDADTGYCFGFSIGNAWGPVGLGTLPGGPTAPLGVSGTLASICACDDPVKVQRNICAGYRDGCADTYPENGAQYAACMASCPDPDFAPASVLCP